MWSTIVLSVWSGVLPVLDFIRSVVLLTGFALGVAGAMILVHVVVDKIARFTQ